MDLTSLYYFTELAKDLHITATANRLFLSQQSLSNHLARLEAYYGAPLFYRRPSLSLTAAGEKVLNFAQQLLDSDTLLRDSLSRIEAQEAGILRFGASPLRMNAALPAILTAFSARYPKVELRLTDNLSQELEPLVLRGDLDFAAILSPEPNVLFEITPLMRDPLYLCVSDRLLRKYYPDEAESIRERSREAADLADFARLPFCFHSNRLGVYIAECFVDRGIVPNVYVTSSDTLISLSLCCEGLAACFATHMRLITEMHRIPEDVNVFPLYVRGKPVDQTLSLVRRKDRELTQYARYFTGLLSAYFAGVEMQRPGQGI